MKMTIEQVKEDIQSGKCQRIYYSANTLWWTHLDDDVTEASDFAHSQRQERHKMAMSDPNRPKESKEKLDALFKMTNKSTVRIPMDPSGSVLLQIVDEDKLNEWISAAEKNPSHFGKLGLDAFMKSHHQNSGDNCSPYWDYYNILIG